MGLATAHRYAAKTILSGPAAGVKATESLAGELGIEDVISADMGGTSFDVAVISGGRASITAENTIEYGLPLKLPAIGIHTIGAGGGSIASLDRGGVLEVGPRSAGADPGPAACGKGGTEPTVSDANVVLGRLGGASLGTGQGIRLRVDEARDAMGRLAERLGTAVHEAAWATIELADEKMARALRRVSVEKGLNPNRFALVSYGGAGPLHAASLARKVGISTILIPSFPGLHSALGCLLAPLRYDFSKAFHRPLNEDALDDLRTLYGDLEEDAKEVLVREGHGEEAYESRYSLDMSYRQQLYHINVPIERDHSAQEIAVGFDTLYRQLYSNPLVGGIPTVVNARLTVEGASSGLTFDDLSVAVAGETTGSADEYSTYFDPDAPLKTPVYRGRSNIPGNVEGPAIVEEPGTTILIPPGWRASVEKAGTLSMLYEGSERDAIPTWKGRR